MFTFKRPITCFAFSKDFFTLHIPFAIRTNGQIRKMSTTTTPPEFGSEQDLVQKHYPFKTTNFFNGVITDTRYPSTAVARLAAILSRLHSTDNDALVNKDWEEIRKKLLWIGGLDYTTETSHAFNDDNHCDLTPMMASIKNESNAKGEIAEISSRNFLGNHITRNSLPVYTNERISNSGSWSTCTNGANQNPPYDVAHIQFQSRIAFKLVWCPPQYEKFVLVDDEGKLLKIGEPQLTSKTLPQMSSRKRNFQIVKGGIYENAAVMVGKQENDEL